MSPTQNDEEIVRVLSNPFFRLTNFLLIPFFIISTKRGVKELDLVSRVTGIPGWYWILGIKCGDTTGVGLTITRTVVQ